MKNLDQAISLYEEDTGGSLGTASTVYVSVPDPAATSSAGTNCASLGLPSLPSGWSYHCAGTQWYRNVDGTGWVPLDFSSASYGSPLGSLPVDPLNATSSGLYYTYVTNGSQYELTAVMESAKFAAQEADDGGVDPAMYEEGTNLALSPFVHGMVGYWAFNEGSGGVGATTVDSSGFGNSGTLQDATSTGTGPTWIASGCIEGDCLSFDGADDYVNIANGNIYSTTVVNGTFTVVAWVNFTAINPGSFWNNPIAAQDQGFGNVPKWIFGYGNGYPSGGPGTGFLFTGSNMNPYFINSPTMWTATPGTWYFIAVTRSGSTFTFYRNGASDGSVTNSNIPASISHAVTFGFSEAGSSYLNGMEDDMRIYNRVLSASEIQAIYNAEK